MYAIIDTEGSGLFDFKQPADAPGQPRLAELVMIFCDEKCEVTNEYQTYIKPDGWEMSPGATAVNKLTTELLLDKGVPIIEALAVYQAAIVDENRIIVAYNAQHDCKQIRAELRRAGLPDLFEQTRNICAMRASKDVMKVSKGYKLSDACAFFKVAHEQVHSAVGDARACLEVFRKLHELGALPEPKIHYAKNPPGNVQPAQPVE